MFLTRVENAVNCLLDAEIENFVSVVRKDDIDKIFADVVNVTFNGCQNHLAFCCCATLLFHERLEETHGRLHSLRRLQHERQLHLTTTKKVTNHLHAFQQDVVDDVQGWMLLERCLELVFE